MGIKLHSLAWKLKLLTYFIFGLSLALLVLIVLLPSSSNLPPSPNKPLLPANLLPGPKYEWSPDHTQIAFQLIDPESEKSRIMVWDTKTNSSSTAATLDKAEFWVSDGQVNLAWLGTNTLAYARPVTDDSLPNWEIIGASTTPDIWYERDIVSFSPDGKKLLTVISRSVPSESLEYEVVVLDSQKIIPTNISVHAITCDWLESTSLTCYHVSEEDKKRYFILKIIS